MLSSKQENPKLNVTLMTQYDDHIPLFYHTFKCDSRSVVEVLAPEVDYWTARDPTLICAPTGMGKTTLACEVLLPRALEQGKNVLFVVNRVALATQLKLRIMDLVDPSLKDCLTETGVRMREQFGRVCVVTYHRLGAFVSEPSNQTWINNLLYVIADEIHIITSDYFNDQCGYYLRLLTSKFQHAVRIYMTATEWDVLLPLAEAEKANYLDCTKLVYPWLMPREFRRYVFPADYSHINLQFFDDLDTILDRIEKKPEEKWMIFMSSKRAGKELAQKLLGKALYLDADSKGTAEWSAILKKEAFDQQVLITTAVLDCGVNIKDKQLRNIVIFTDNRTSLLQMLGRKRCCEGEHVNLYVFDIEKKTIAMRYHNGLELCRWLERYEAEQWEGRSKMASEIWHGQDESLRLYFHLTKGNLVPNHIAFFSLKRKLVFYRSLIEGKTTFQQVVRSWLGMPEEDALPEPESSLEARFIAFCECHLEQELSEEEIAQFREMTIALADRVGQIKTRADRIDALGREALNKRLETITGEYRLARSSWRIIKAEEDFG